MKKLFLILIASFLFIFNVAASADIISDLDDLLGFVKNISQTETDIAGYDSNIEDLQKDIKAEMSGNYGIGALNFKDFASWGNDANDWESVLHMAQNGGSSGGNLGSNVNQLRNQFPIDTNFFNQQQSDKTQQQYYALTAQTALAARAASQTDYNQIQQQINNEQQLKNQIDKTQNLKEATDLQNRLQVENNLIQLETLRQLSLSNQQQALLLQANANAALQDAHLLSH
jgi:hypothetical protein